MNIFFSKFQGQYPCLERIGNSRTWFSGNFDIWRESIQRNRGKFSNTSGNVDWVPGKKHIFPNHGNISRTSVPILDLFVLIEMQFFIIAMKIFIPIIYENFANFDMSSVAHYIYSVASGKSFTYVCTYSIRSI